MAGLRELGAAPRGEAGDLGGAADVRPPTWEGGLPSALQQTRAGEI